MLRPYFLFNRELLTELARAGYELMVAAVDDSNARVGMVASIQTFSDNLPICTASFPEASGLPAESGFPFPTSTPTLRKFCFARRSFDFFNNTTFFPTNASKFFVHGAIRALTLIMIEVDPILWTKMGGS